MTLADLVRELRAFASGALSLAQLQERFAPVLAADSLDVEESDSAPWDIAPDEARLFWRLVYLVEAEWKNEEELRALAERIPRCLERTHSAAITLELLPIVADQERFCGIVGRHAAGVISRTGFLSVIAESGYPAHAKLWLAHASLGALRRLCDQLSRGAYESVASALERVPE